MKTLSQIEKTEAQAAPSGEKGFAVDTTFVLFFLALEFGHSIQSIFSLDGFVLALTLSAIVVLPYFLPSNEKPVFGSWLMGRSLIAGFAIFLGVMYRQSLGVVLPEMFRFLPMTLLIVAAMLSCYIQFYGFLRLRFVK
jgi:hypothetical protein